jgi:lariat debranching enzyme
VQCNHRVRRTFETFERMGDYLNIAVEGCCHGELDEIYRVIVEQECRTGRKVDLLVVCGDFECIRDIVDLECLAVPQKYRKLNTFHQYVTGEKVAPVMTLFVGGNHEASNVLQSLYYGGYVAPKIYFMGFAGAVTFRGLRIAGLSGIFNERHYRVGASVTIFQ